MSDNYLLLKMSLGVIATIGLYSVLYRENKFYRFFEHMFLGLAVGWMLVILWTETLYDQWWSRMIGSAAEGNAPGTPGHWAYVLLLPLGLLGYFVFSQKHNWLSRIPIGIILGLWSGQQVQVWWNRYGPQIADSVKPIFPTTWERLTQPNTNLVLLPDGTVGPMPPDQAHALAVPVYPAEALGSIVLIVTLLSVLSYFLFSFDIKNKVLRNTTVLGRWLLMVGFGAIFGSTVMMRFTLLIDRMYFIWIEWLKQGILHK
jgi:hypothetical protein